MIDPDLEPPSWWADVLERTQANWVVSRSLELLGYLK
jgi:hypothetical protein